MKALEEKVDRARAGRLWEDVAKLAGQLEERALVRREREARAAAGVVDLADVDAFLARTTQAPGANDGEDALRASLGLATRKTA